jgi:hypothetical protein
MATDYINVVPARVNKLNRAKAIPIATKLLTDSCSFLKKIKHYINL